MAKRGFVPNADEDFSALSLADLNQRITWAKWRAENADKPSAKKSALALLVRLEAVREERYQIPASHRAPSSS